MILKALYFLFFYSLCQIAVAQAPEIRLIEFSNSNCDEESDPYRLRTRIVRKEIKGKVLTIEIATTDTCCVSIRPMYSLSNNVLSLDERDFGDECECICCYQFIYKLEGEFNDQTIIKFRGNNIEESREKFKTYPVKFSIRNADTVNYIDKYGLRQGRWYTGGIWDYQEMIDNRTVKYVKTYPNGSIKSLISKKTTSNPDSISFFLEYANFTDYFEYFEKGSLRRVCISENWKESYKESGRCREWNERGELIFEGPYKEN